MVTVEKIRTDAGFIIDGDWAVQAKLLREKYPQLTSADLKFEVGKESELLKRIRTRLNKKREETINIIKKGQQAKDQASI